MTKVGANTNALAFLEIAKILNLPSSQKKQLVSLMVWT